MCDKDVSVVTYLVSKITNAVSQFRIIGSLVKALKAFTVHILTEQIDPLLSINSERNGGFSNQCIFYSFTRCKKFFYSKTNYYVKEL